MGAPELVARKVQVDRRTFTLAEGPKRERAKNVLGQSRPKNAAGPIRERAEYVQVQSDLNIYATGPGSRAEKVVFGKMSRWTVNNDAGSGCRAEMLSSKIVQADGIIV